MALRPGSRVLVDFVCEDNGDGPYLVEGSMNNPPTQAEVDALTNAQLDAAQRAKAGTLAERLSRLGISVDELKVLVRST